MNRREVAKFILALFGGAGLANASTTEKPKIYDEKLFEEFKKVAKEQYQSAKTNIEHCKKTIVEKPDQKDVYEDFIRAIEHHEIRKLREIATHLNFNLE